MDNSEKILQQLFKSAPLPELSADFTSKLLEKTSLLPKPKAVSAKPLIHSLILGLGFLLPVVIAVAFYFEGNTSNIQMLDFHTHFRLAEYLKQFLSNYLIISFATLVLIWFLIDFKFINFRRVRK